MFIYGFNTGVSDSKRFCQEPVYTGNLSQLDAMGYGLPVVSTNVGGIPKIVHDGENGVCCEAGDVDRMSRAITELMLNEELRENAGRDSMKIVKAKYSLEAHIEMLERVYEGTME